MQEQFSYSLMASGLGILIVFSILVILSGLMVLIRKASDEKENKSKKAQAPVQPQQAPQAPVQPVENYDWLLAAVAAYLAAEEDEQIIPRASEWTPSDSERFDPWINGKKLRKTAPGA